MASDQCDTGDCQELQAFAYWGIAGAQLGALMGLLIGGAASTERWAVVPVLGTSSVLELVEFAVQPGNAIRLHLSISK